VGIIGGKMKKCGAFWKTECPLEQRKTIEGKNMQG
jgi:hypothetical protein